VGGVGGGDHGVPAGGGGGAVAGGVSAGPDAGYLASPRLREVHWQAGGWPVPAFLQHLGQA
jgi:hypothetical protein